MAIGDGRRKTLAALEKKDRLDPIDAPDSLQELVEAVRAISIPGVISPPEDAIERIEAVHGKLPDEAKQHYITDETLLRRINAARRQLNEWMGRKKREQEMPGPMEAGPANYPVKKLRKRQRSERNAKEELDEKIRRIRAGAKGGRQRALNAIGSSVAEQNEQRREANRETLRDELEEGDYVLFTDLPDPDKRLGRVVRVNKKSVRVEYATDHGRIDAGTELRVELTPEYVEKVPENEAETLLNEGER